MGNARELLGWVVLGRVEAIVPAALALCLTDLHITNQESTGLKGINY